MPSDKYIFIKEELEKKGNKVILVNETYTLKKLKEIKYDKVKFVEYLEKEMSKIKLILIILIL